MASDGLTTAEKRRALPWLLTANTSTVIYLNLALGGPIFMLFLDRMELEKSQIGLALSVTPFFGILALFLAPFAARRGYKRVFLVARVLWKFIALGLVATPWVLGHYGGTAAFAYVVGVLAATALCRTAANSAAGPWMQEIIPAKVRGRFSAIS